jgi:hypothetical protein
MQMAQDSTVIDQPTGDLSKNDIFDLLGEGDASENEKVITDIEADGTDSGKTDKSKEKSTEKTEDAKQDENIEDEEEIKLEDELEYKEIPKRQQILKEFPELFKKFPGIEHAIYREKQYAEIFPTVTDAKETLERAQSYNQFEQSLLSGNIENILTAVKDADSSAFGKITGGMLQTLYKVDQGAYYNTLNHVIKTTLVSAFNTGKQNNDEQLQIAAQLLHRYIYQTPNVTPPEQVRQQQQNQNDPREQQIRNREVEFNKRELGTAIQDVNNRTEGVIRSTIEKHIDPKNIMTPYVKKNAIRDIISEVDKEILEDNRFIQLKDKLWQVAHSEGYSEASKKRIREALLSKARTILPTIIQRVKMEALKNQASRSREAGESTDKRPVTSGRPATSNSSGKAADAKSIPKHVKTLEFLMQD